MTKEEELGLVAMELSYERARNVMEKWVVASGESEAMTNMSKIFTMADEWHSPSLKALAIDAYLGKHVTGKYNTLAGGIALLACDLGNKE